MLTKYKVVIADTSCFILLDKIAELSILQKLFGEVYTTPEVMKEFGKPLPDWIHVEASIDRKYQYLLAQEVDLGEASAIALSLEKNDTLLILDDRRARRLAEKLDRPFTGTLGVVARAAREEIISSLDAVIAKIKQTNFRFSEATFDEIRKAAQKIK